MLPEENTNKIQSLVFHIDMDSFYASVEQALHPEYRNKPLVVIGHGKGTCVIASSKEAKKNYGIKVGWKIYEAINVCPKIAAVPARLNLYSEISKKIFNVFYKYTPYVEKFSIDEGFLDFTKVFVLENNYFNLARQIKEEISKTVGDEITCSIGIASNRLMAKLCSDLIKPDGIIYMPKERYIDILNNVNLNDLCGIGRKIEMRLNKIGVYDFKQLRTVKLNKLKAEFGNLKGRFLFNASRGKDFSDIKYIEELPKSVGHHRTLSNDIYYLEDGKKALAEICVELSCRLRRKGLKGKMLFLNIKNKYYKGVKVCIKFGDYTWDESNIFKTLLPVLNETKIYPIRFFALTMFDLVLYSEVSYNMFEAKNKKDQVLLLMDKVNSKYQSIAMHIPLI